MWFKKVYGEEFKVGDWVTFWSEIDKKLETTDKEFTTKLNFDKKNKMGEIF